MTRPSDRSVRLLSLTEGGAAVIAGQGGIAQAAATEGDRPEAEVDEQEEDVTARDPRVAAQTPLRHHGVGCELLVVLWPSFDHMVHRVGHADAPQRLLQLGLEPCTVEQSVVTGFELGTYGY